jgi:hypothetical protein
MYFVNRHSVVLSKIGHHFRNQRLEKIEAVKKC